MAKIGNEAKLVLKLAKERADREKEEVQRRLDGVGMKLTDAGKDYARGEVTGYNRYEQILWDIVREMER